MEELIEEAVDSPMIAIWKRKFNGIISINFNRNINRLIDFEESERLLRINSMKDNERSNGFEV